MIQITYCTLHGQEVSEDAIVDEKKEEIIKNENFSVKELIARLSCFVDEHPNAFIDGNLDLLLVDEIEEEKGFRGWTLSIQK